MKFSRAIDEVHMRGRRVGIVALLGLKAIGRGEAGQHNQRVNRQQKPDSPAELERCIKSRAERGISTATSVFWVHSGTLTSILLAIGFPRCPPHRATNARRGPRCARDCTKLFMPAS